MQCRPPTSPLFPYTTLFRSGLAARRVQAAREHGVGTGREEIVLGARGEVTEPPVVDRPQRVAPRGRAAPAPELPGYVVGGVDLEAVAAVAAGVAEADGAGRPESHHRPGAGR